MKKSYLKYLFINFFFLCACVNNSFSQEKYCGTDEVINELFKTHPELKHQQEEYNALIQQKIAAKALRKNAVEDKYIIPVVFHIIHTNGPENISDEQIFDQMKVLQNDFRKLNADTSKIIKNTPFDTLAADINIEFRLAQIDPKGNCTNGIDRIYSPLTNFADNNSKLNPWPRDKYLNVWVTKTIGASGNVAGYAYYPGTAPSASVDGIIILSDYIGSIGTSNLNKSRALTHEIGHYLNLMHVWGSTNAPEVDCNGTDQVDDTPTTRGHLTCNHSPYCTIYNFINTVYKFPGVTTNSGTTDPSTPPVNNGATFSNPKAVGVSANSSENGVFSFSDWDKGGEKANHNSNYDSLTGSINTNKYYEVTIGPKYGNSFTLSALSFSFKRDSLGARTFAVRSSVDNFTNNLPASISPANTQLAVKSNNIVFAVNDTTSVQNGSTIAISSVKDALSPVTFRIYGWNAEDSTGTFGIDSLAFTGTSGVIENTQNYMDYSYCSIMFTKGQKARMRAALESNVASRSSLWTTANLNATGTNNNGAVCKPVADFYTTDLPFTCPNNLIFFKSNIQNASPTSPTTVQWEFQGGNPATSTELNPIVKFADVGYHNVKLTATNAAGSSTSEKLGYVYIRPTDGEYRIWTTISEGFEDTTSLKEKWHFVDFGSDNNTWQIANNAGSSGKNSIRMKGFQNTPLDVDALVTPFYNMYMLKDVTLSFKYTAGSRASSSSDMNDQLTVYYSVNCGSTWFAGLTLKGAELTASGGYQLNYYIPTLASQWQSKSIKIPIINPVNNKIVFKFEYKTGSKSNNVYIDDINLTGTVGIDENEISASTALIYPNPTSDLTKVNYHLSQPAVATLELTDILGKQLTRIDQGNQGEGDYSIELSKERLNLKNGIYFLKLTVGKAAFTYKLVISE
ncbi:MAG TPA: M43 family zinc metalloprotease [Bacteroidia bacterium]|nr:M43 family zinc metalloprotease [Bacteroidia bacterium]